MKTLENHVLIYDKNCPLCNLYTGAFIKTNMLDKNGRADYCSMDFSLLPHLDLARAKDEIALVNTKTGSITYGIDSLFKILSSSIPVLGYVFKWSAFKFAMGKFYALVSYNRKAISPEKTFESPSSCIPSLHLGYRWAYILLSWVFTSLALNQYAVRFAPLIPPTDFFREWLICGGQIIFQSVVVWFINKGRLIHYLGNLMTVSNIGALLLLPALFIPAPIAKPGFYMLFFAIVVAIMLFEHYRRAKVLELTVWVSMSWMVYRLIVLGIILYL